MHPPFVPEHHTRVVGLVRDTRDESLCQVADLTIVSTCNVNCSALAMGSQLSGRGGRRAESCRRRAIRTVQRARERGREKRRKGVEKEGRRGGREKRRKGEEEERGE